MKRLAIFASGSGTNAENIARHFMDSRDVSIELILTNNPHAGVLERARNLGIPSLVFSKKDFYESDKIITRLEELKTDLVVLAGFLWLVPESLINKFQGRIINIHPALLPKFGGKGFYGLKVHEAVLSSGEKTSGITIHFVNDKFDEGIIIFQKECEILPGETSESLVQKIHRLEYENYPRVIEELLQKT